MKNHSSFRLSPRTLRELEAIASNYDDNPSWALGEIIHTVYLLSLPDEELLAHFGLLMQVPQSDSETAWALVANHYPEGYLLAMQPVCLSICAIAPVGYSRELAVADIATQIRRKLFGLLPSQSQSHNDTIRDLVLRSLELGDDVKKQSSFRLSINTRKELERLASRYDDNLTRALEEAVHAVYLLSLPDEELLAHFGSLEQISEPRISPFMDSSPRWALVVKRAEIHGFLQSAPVYRAVAPPEWSRDDAVAGFAEKLRGDIVNDLTRSP